MRGVVQVEFSLVVVGNLLFLVALVLLWDNVREWRNATSWAEEAVGRRIVASCAYRAGGKFLLWVDMCLVYLARPKVLPPLRNWLIQNPLTIFLIVLAALLLFFVNDCSEWLWRRQFFAQAKEHALAAPPDNTSTQGGAG